MRVNEAALFLRFRKRAALVSNVISVKLSYLTLTILPVSASILSRLSSDGREKS